VQLNLKSKVIDLRNVWNKKVLFLVALMVGLSIPGSAWGNYNFFLATSVFDVALENRNGKVPEGAQVKSFFTPPSSPGKNTTSQLDLYYSEGAAIDLETVPNTVTKVNFSLLYDFISTVGPSNAPSGTAITFTSSHSSAPGPLIFKGGEEHFTATSSIQTSQAGQGARITATDDSKNEHRTTIAAKKISISSVKAGEKTRTGGSDWAQNNNHGGGVMLVGVNYPEKSLAIPEDFNAKISPVAVQLTLESPYRWEVGSLDVWPRQKNGIKASVYTKTQYSRDAVVHFTGTPEKAEDTDFTVLGTVVDDKGVAVLTKVSKLIRITPEKVTISRLENTGRLSFLEGVEVSGTGSTEVEFKDCMPYPTLGNHNLFNSEGTPLFSIGSNRATWNGMTVTRSFTFSNRVRYDFSGTPNTKGQTRAEEFYAGGLLDGSNRSYRLDPFTVTVVGGPIAFQDIKDIAPISIPHSNTALTAITGPTSKVTSVSGGAAAIEAIALTEAAAGSSSALTLTLTNTKLTVTVAGDTLQVTGIPFIPGSDTIYVRAKTANGAAQVKPFTISVSALGTRELTLTDSGHRRGIAIGPNTKLPISLEVVGSPDLTVTGVTGVTAQLSSPAVGLKVSHRGTTVTLDGTTLAEGQVDLTISALVDGTARTLFIPVTVTTVPPAVTPELDEIAQIQITASETPLPHTITLTSTPRGAIAATALTGPKDSTGSGALACTWKGLKISVSGDKITISKDSSAAVAAPVSGTFTVKAAVTIGTTTTHAEQSFTITLSPKGTPTILAIPPLWLITEDVVDNTIKAESSAGTVDLKSVAPGNWNGLLLSVYGTSIQVLGSPLEAGSHKFTIAGTVGTTQVTGEFVIVVMGVELEPGKSSELGAPSTWKKERRDTRYDLNIPLTKEFIADFDTNKDGKLTTNELLKVIPAVKAPNAALKNADWAVNGDTLHLGLEFTPKKGHANDWYKGLYLESLTFVGSNDKTMRYAFSGGGVELEKGAFIRKKGGGGGGCDAGASFLALLVLAPLALRLRKKS
jgi:Synergist-CTERM protein sorting domain-containing protein